MDEISVCGEAGKLPLIGKSTMLSRLSETHVAEPQFPRHLSVGSGSILLQNSYHGDPVYHRRHLTETYLASDIHQHRSIRDEVGHAAAETYLITSLTFMLLRYLGVGYRWVLNFAALYFYACFLMPGFIQVGWYYFFSNCVHRSIVYGGEARNRLDLYLPKGMEEELRPVVIFVTGGAWIIGYKAWGSLIGKQLVERGVIVACLDYRIHDPLAVYMARNFPQGTISDMVGDVSQGISYVLSKLTYINGDPSRVFLVGQSAGSHIAACVLLEQAKKEYVDNVSKLNWRTSQLKAFFGISGGYNLLQLVDHFHQRGLYRSIFLSIMEGNESLPRYSPEIVVKSPIFDNVASFLPPIHLFHGMADYSIPYDASTSFAQTLSLRGIQVKTKLYPNKTHTDIFVQDPLRGGHDELLADILALVHDGDKDANAHVQAPPLKRLVPEILLQLARIVSPF